MKRIDLAPGTDLALRTMREQGHSWRAIGQALGLGVRPVMRRAALLGLDETARLNSGKMTGVAIAAGARPDPRRFVIPCDKARLGRHWHDSMNQTITGAN